MAELVKPKSHSKRKSKHTAQKLDETNAENDIESLREVLREITLEKHEATEVQHESESCLQPMASQSLTEEAEGVEIVKDSANAETDEKKEVKTEPEKTTIKQPANVAPVYPLLQEALPTPLLTKFDMETGNQSHTISTASMYPLLETIESPRVEEECDEGVIVSPDDIVSMYPLIRDISIELPPVQQSETRPHLYPLLVNEDVFPPSGLVCSPSAPLLEDEDNELGFALPKEAEMVEPPMEPFTEDQIRTLYYNPEMEHLDIIIDRFFQNSTSTDHEFHRMILSYRSALDKSQSISDDLESMKKNLEEAENMVWEVKSHNETMMGRCQDGAAVQKVITYETTSVNGEACLQFSESQTNLRESLHGEFVSSMFDSHSSKLRIENYLSDFFEENKHLSVMPNINPLRGRGHDPQFENQIGELKEMIMILFAFQRKHITNKQFLDDTRSWLSAMVSRLLLHATFEDHLFLTLHVLHCLPGISRWAVGFIQPTEVRHFDHRENHVWDNEEFNHNVAVLALILKPMKYREEMLTMNMINEELVTAEDKGWIMVDSEGEDDEKLESVEVSFHEKDVLSLLNQLSFEKSLKHLFMPGDDQGELCFSNESNFVRMLAFARRAVDILGVAMRNYPQAKYKRLNRRLGQMIRHIVHSLCLGWMVFKSHGFQIPVQMSQRIQLEADTVLLLSVVRILQAPSLGAWQYLSLLPFDSLSTTSVWNLLRIIHLRHLMSGDGSSGISNIYVPQKECIEDLSEERIMNEFGEKLSQMTSNEATFLLSTLSNIAGMQGCDSRILEFITKEIFLICFVNTSTRTSYSKLGKELIQSICLQHPKIIYEILKWTDSHLSDIGMASLYLFQALPLHGLQLSQTNCGLLRGWLVHCLPSDPASRLARLVLSCFHWSFVWDLHGYDQNGQSCSGSAVWPRNDVRLFLPIHVHKFMAMSVFEALYILLLGKATVGKLTTDAVMAFPTNFIPSNGNDNTSKVSSLIPQGHPNDLQLFSTWAWCFCLRIRLHSFSILSGKYFFIKQNVTLEPERSNLLSHVLGEIVYFAQNPLSYLSDDDSGAKMEDLDSKSLLYSYLSFNIRSMGYSTNEFISHGLQRLLDLLEASFFVPALHCLFNCLPMFYANKKAIVELLNSENLVRCLDLLLKQDAIAFDSKSRNSMTIQLSALILMHMELLSTRSDLIENVANFWFYLLTKIMNWPRSRDILYILNIIIRRLFAADPHLNISITFFKEILKGQHTICNSVSHQSSGILSSIVNFIWSRFSEFLSESPAVKDFPWLRLVILRAERRSYEEENNLIGSLELKIYGIMEGVEFIEKIYENTCSKIGVDRAKFPLQKLSIFRCASMILETPVTHEILPLLWNEFLGYYFIRSSKSSCGLGYNLLSYSPESRALMKKLKDKCRTSIDELKQVANQFRDKNIPEKLERLHRAILLWLDEQRLHSHKLDLKSLPSQYAAPLFESLVSRQQERWFGFVDREKINAELNGICEMWFQNVLEKNARPHQEHLNKLASSLEIKTPHERLLTSFGNKPTTQIVPSPVLRKMDCVFSELAPDIYLDERKLNVIIHGDLKIICEMASMHEKKLRKHQEMDEYYLDNLKKLYSNITIESLAVVPCWSYINPTHKCRGGAVLRKRHEQKQLNEMVARKKNEVKELIGLLLKETSKMAPLVPASRAVVRSEAIILKLIRRVLKASERNSTSEERAVADRSAETGINLFYLLVSFITPLIDHCPSAKQFTYSCIESLGKTFIINNPTQPRTLLLVILKTPELVCQLSPFFNPNSNPGSFVELYEELQTLINSMKFDTAASLAAKFDIGSWLKFSNHNSQSNLRFLNFIISALSSLGQKPRDEAQSLACVFRSHLKTLCLTNLPFYLMPLLQGLISASESQILNPEVWEDYTSMLGFDFTNVTTDYNFENTFHSEYSELVTKHQIFQLLDNMSSFFGSQLIASQEICRKTMNNKRNWDVSPGEYPWLYTKWGAYVPHLSRVFYSTAALLVIRVHGMINSSTTYDARAVIKDVADMHERIQSLYLPFISKSCLGRCWLENISAITHAESDISCMVASWVNSIELLHTHFEHDKLNCGILNHMCSFYVNDLGVQEMPDFLSNIFKHHLVTLPWSHFQPQFICINNMAKAIRSTKPCLEMMGNIFCAVDWNYVFPTLTRNASPAEVLQLHSLVFDILIRLACEEAILENTVLPQLLSSTGIFEWPNKLDAPSYSQSLQWFAENCDPTPLITFDLTLKSCQVIRLFKEACSFYPKGDAKSTSSLEFHEQLVRENLFKKRRSYVAFIVNIVVKLSSAKNPEFDRLDVALSNLLSEVDAIMSKENEDATTSHHSRQLCTECLSLLNRCLPMAANIFLQVFQLWMESSVMSPIVPSMVLSACRTLTNVSHLSRLLEVFLVAHFSLDVTATERQGWSRVLASIEFPEICQDEFIAECLEKEYYLTLYLFVLFKLSICRSLHDELSVMLKLNDWNTSAKLSASHEAKIFLWWHKILELSVRQVLFGGSKLAVRSALVQMIPALMVLGEDKSAAGLFGAIGFGKKSNMSLRFRVVACGFSAFLSSVLINDNNLQYTGEHEFDNLSTMLKATNAQTVAQLQQQTSCRLHGMLQDKTYSNYNQQVQLALKLSQDKSMKLCNFGEVMLQLVCPMYQEYYLGVLRSNCE